MKVLGRVIVRFVAGLVVFVVVLLAAFAGAVLASWLWPFTADTAAALTVIVLAVVGLVCMYVLGKDIVG